MPEDEKPRWLDKSRNVSRIYWGLWIVSVFLAVADFVYRRHVVFPFEEMPVIYGFYGFISFFGIVLAGKELRKFLSKDEDYYDR